jgi:hypothetical protein
MLEERRKIVASREHLEKRQQARRKKFLENTLCGLAILALSYGMYWLVDFMITRWPEGR